MLKSLVCGLLFLSSAAMADGYLGVSKTDARCAVLNGQDVLGAENEYRSRSVVRVKSVYVMNEDYFGDEFGLNMDVVAEDLRKGLSESYRVVLSGKRVSQNGDVSVYEAPPMLRDGEKSVYTVIKQEGSIVVELTTKFGVRYTTAYYCETGSLPPFGLKFNRN